MAYQFARIEIFSRKGKAGRGTDFIFDEVARQPDACLHVDNPHQPEIVFGKQIDDLRHLHDQRASAARATVNGKSKAIRRDQNTLGTVILSHPATAEEYRRDHATRRDVQAWERLCVTWLRKCYGDELISVVRHTDESHVHLHAYLVPADQDMRAGKFHPGYTAKNAIKSAGPKEGEDESLLNKRADRAYKQAMREWLDDFHRMVAAPSGLARLGPGKRRLSRAQWQKEQAQARALKTTLERAQKIKVDGMSFVARVKADAASANAMSEKQTESASAAVEIACEAQKRAQDAEMKAQAVIALAEKYSGWAGWFRALWDNFRKSALTENIRREARIELDYWRTAARASERRTIEVARQLRETEKRAKSAADEIMKTRIERDSLRSLSKPEREDDAEAAPHPKLALKAQRRDKRTTR